MSLDVERIRAETPGCAHVLHLNAAGSSLPSRRTLDATLDHLRLEAEIGGYEAADRARPVLDGFYPSIATLIGAEPGEIAYVENATRGWDLAFYSLDFKPGDRILTCVSEYSSNYISYLQVARKTGAEIVVVPDDRHGQIDLAALERAIDKRTKLVSISHIPTQGGLVQPAEAVGKIVNDAGILYLLDACQSVGQLPVDVRAIGCDFLSTTGRKYLRGPRGTGFLYVRREVIPVLEPPMLDLHAAQWTAPDQFITRDDARRFENWETNYAGKVGLTTALEYAMGWGLDAIYARVRELASSLRACLRDIPGVTVTDIGTEQCGIVTFMVAGHPASDIQQTLSRQAIHVTTSSTSSTRFDMEARGLTLIVRASVHYYNDEAEIARFCAAIREIVG